MSSISAAEQGEGATITAIYPDIIQSHILNRLDGRSLAATSCVSTQYLSLCDDDHIWKDICSSTWPSTADPRVIQAISAFPSGHRSFYSDAFLALRHRQSQKTHHHRVPETFKLISAVDIYYDDKLILSKVLVTETFSTWFLNTPFRLELLDTNETLAMPLGPDNGTWNSRAKERLRVSWILINPVKRRAINVASQKAVDVRRNKLTDDIQLCYASVMAAGSGGELVSSVVVVTCGKQEGGGLLMKDASMQVEEMNGKILTGLESLRILEPAMEGQRGKSDIKAEKYIYEKFLRMKVRCRERCLAMVGTATGICIFLAFCIIFLS